MWTDPLVEEVQKRRRELMSEFDYDPKKFLDFLKKEKAIYTYVPKKRRFSLEGMFKGGGPISEEKIDEVVKEWDIVKE